MDKGVLPSSVTPSALSNEESEKKRESTDEPNTGVSDVEVVGTTGCPLMKKKEQKFKLITGLRLQDTYASTINLAEGEELPMINGEKFYCPTKWHELGMLKLKLQHIVGSTHNHLIKWRVVYELRMMLQKK